MAKSLTAGLVRLINQLQAERQKHGDALAAIDEQFEAFGIVAAASSKKKKRRGRRGPGRPKGTTTKKKASKKRGGKKKVSKQKRRAFRQTAEEFVLGLLKGRRKMTTAQINGKWKEAGRGATANVTLGKLVSEKKLKRENIEGERGSQYSLATGGGKKKSSKKKAGKKKAAKKKGGKKRATKKISKKKSGKTATEPRVASAPQQGEKKPTDQS